MKKLLSVLFAAALVANMGICAFAAEEEIPEDMDHITFTKEYMIRNNGTVSPEETFTFSITPESVTDAADGITTDNMPIPTVGSVHYDEGEAGDETGRKEVRVDLPDYNSVGVYKYIIRENAGTKGGVIYYQEDIRLVVTVVQMNGLLRVAGVHTELCENGVKTDNFPNVFEAGSLSVKKEVTGLLGDQSKSFDVTVTFLQNGEYAVSAPISYAVGMQAFTIEEEDWQNGQATVKISLKHDETVTFNNIPYNVTYTVVEDAYEGYETTYEFSDAEKKINSCSDQVVITNDKGGEIDTGVTLDSLPYMLLITTAAAGLVVMVVTKRRASDF